LHSEQYLSVFPKFFELVIVALIGREEVENHIAKIHHNPAVTGIALFFTFSFVVDTHLVDGSVGERIEHAVTGAGANYKIIGKGYYFFQVYQNDVLAFFIFKGVDNIACKV
jgi:hypothetical protein